MIKKTGIIHIVLIILISTILFAAEHNKVANVGDTALQFRLKDVSGQRISLDDMFESATIVVMNFFADYCIPCRKEMPLLISLNEKYGKKGLKIYLINEGDKPQKVKKFIKQFKINIPVLLDKYKIVGQRYSVKSLPVTYVFNDKKIMIKSIRGKIKSIDEVLDTGVLSVLDKKKQ